jgi:hypothetical protein
MIQLEYINEELCSECTYCCKLIYRRDISPASIYVRKEGDWFKQAFDLYGVYPLRDPSIENGDYCEFYDSSIGCIIEREKRPRVCRIHVCDKLLLDYKTTNKLEVLDNERNKRPTKRILNLDKTQVIYLFDEVDPEEIKQLMEHRLNICKSCTSSEEKNELLMCKLCHCGLIKKTALIYSLDEEGHAISGILSNGSFASVCPLKKW